MITIRLKSKIAPEEMESKVGKLLDPRDFGVVLTQAARVERPDGKPLAIYLPGAIPQEMRDAVYPTLHELRKFESHNRGNASGYRRIAPKHGGEKAGTRTSTSDTVSSAIIGSFDPAGGKQYCRLTAWTGTEAEKFESLQPLFQRIGSLYQQYVPERYAVQMEVVNRTQAEWIIHDTPFSTVTVNNSYPTGVHQDSGDLPEGFSNVTVLRRGKYSGGMLTFPEYGVSVDLQDGDTLLMDAHDWHGNTVMTCGVCGERIAHTHEECDTERISIVCYYRTKMRECGTFDEEYAKAMEFADKGTARGKRWS